MEYTPELIRKMQLVELDMLKEVDRICRGNGIVYVAEAGTALGAVRHKGFIPWDDDVDIMMLRPEYEKFITACETYLDKKKYFLQNYKTDPGYRWGYTRILRNNTRFERSGHGALKSRNGIFIDIFPADSYPESGLERTKSKIFSWIARKGLYSEVGKTYAKSFINRLGFKILNLFPKENYTKILEKLTKKYGKIDSQLVRPYCWGDKKADIGYKKEWFCETREAEFENIMILIPRDIDGYLSFVFGENYMIPLPEDKRTPGHPADYIGFPEDN